MAESRYSAYYDAIEIGDIEMWHVITIGLLSGSHLGGLKRGN